MSFRSLDRRFYPASGARKRAAAVAAVGLVALLAGCGGAKRKAAPAEFRTLSGPGFSFSAPASWSAQRRGQTLVVAPRGEAAELLSVARYTTLKPYRPELFARAAAELDRVAAQLAAGLGGSVASRATIRVAGGRVRRYDLAYARAGERRVDRVAFVLQGRVEYLLLCRWRTGDAARVQAACDRLYATFTPA